LDEAGIPYDAQHPGFDDSDLRPGTVTAPQWVAALAYLKAAAGVAHAADAIVLGADTAIIKDEDLIGTPRDRTEAHRMLRALSDGSHDVVTGVALIDPASGRRTFFVDRATVRVGHLSDCMIAAYLATDAWRGKAGGYNLRERLDDGWPLSCSGDPTTVLGLPMGVLVGLGGRLEQFEAARESEAQKAKVPA
jgi:septum formation protein